MDCEYLLVYRTGKGVRNEFQHRFDAITPEEATETARQIINDHQLENVQEFPFAPVVVEGELYRQLEELSGAEFIKTIKIVG